jgi:hypothetical protein
VSKIINVKLNDHKDVFIWGWPVGQSEEIYDQSMLLGHHETTMNTFELYFLEAKDSTKN